MIVVDSSVWIDYFRDFDTPQTARLDRLFGTEELLIGDLIVVEVLQGARTDAEFDRVHRILQAFDQIDIGGANLAIQAARNYRALRARGITIRKTIDTLIATRCILDGHRLLYSDRDFDPFVTHLGLQTVGT